MTALQTGTAHFNGAFSLTSLLLAAGIENMYERAQCIRKILLGVPRATLVVMRYLFAFLNQ